MAKKIYSYFGGVVSGVIPLSKIPTAHLLVWKKDLDRFGKYNLKLTVSQKKELQKINSELRKRRR